MKTFTLTEDEIQDKINEHQQAMTESRLKIKNEIDRINPFEFMQQTTMNLFTCFVAGRREEMDRAKGAIDELKRLSNQPTGEYMYDDGDVK